MATHPTSPSHPKSPSHLVPEYDIESTDSDETQALRQLLAVYMICQIAQDAPKKATTKPVNVDVNLGTIVIRTR